MDVDDRVDIHEVEADAEKTGLLILVSTVFLGAAFSASITLGGGDIVKAVLSVERQSDRWIGVSGDLIGERNETSLPVHRLKVPSDAESTSEVNLRGIDDGRHLFASIPFYSDRFRVPEVKNVSDDDLNSGGIFDPEDFPVFYPGYSSIGDSPAETFQQEASIGVLGKRFSGLKTELGSGAEIYLLSYETEKGREPLLISRIKSRSPCQDGSSCAYEFLLPKLNGSRYSFYMLPQDSSVTLNVLIDGEDRNTFKYPARPYNLTVQTRDGFRNGEPVDREFVIEERSGNNLFSPSVSGYTSSARLKDQTVNGSASVLFVPTGYSSPDEYRIQVKVPSAGPSGSQKLQISRDVIEFTSQGPAEKGFEEEVVQFRKEVNRFRPIASCLFSRVSSGNVRILEPDTNTQQFKLSRGIPYVLEANSSLAGYRLREPGSHLVMAPVFGGETVDRASDGLYETGSNVVFTPTLKSSEDNALSLDLVDTSGDVQEVNLSVASATCKDTGAGVSGSTERTEELKKRINSIRPVLRSMFVAGK
jgi:hypothetical protein